jgi:rod shape-determining protein MreC
MSRINLVALAVFAGLLAWVFAFPGETTRSIQQRALSIFSPFQKTGNAVKGKIADGRKPQRPPEELEAESVELKREIAALRVQSQELDDLLTENNRFRQMLNFERRSKLRLIPAKVIGRGMSTWWNTVTIDRGYRDGVAADSPVVTDVGLVGKVAYMDADTATVILLTDERCQLGARIEGTPDRGIIMGARGATKIAPDLRLKYLSKDASPPLDAQVFSSNDGGLFPEGILLGYVRQFNTLELYGEALVRPAVDFSDLQFLFVIERESDVGDAGISANTTTAAGAAPVAVEGATR